MTVFGAQGENCTRYLSKGRRVAIDGRLEWREWETRTDRSARQSISSLIPCSSSAGAKTPAARTETGSPPAARATESDVPVDTGDFETAPVGGGAADDDIPF